MQPGAGEDQVIGQLTSGGRGTGCSVGFQVPATTSEGRSTRQFSALDRAPVVESELRGVVQDLAAECGGFDFLASCVQELFGLGHRLALRTVDFPSGPVSKASQ